MYSRAFGLTQNPFSLTPDPAFLFLTEQHREALAGLTYALLQRKGIAVMTGDAGTGKTTLLSRILGFLPASRLQFALIVNPTLTPAEFLELALLDFGVTEVPESKAQRIWVLQNLILRGHREGKVSALIVDEAHKLSQEVLEEIRLLGNFEEADQKLLQVLLIGQNELDEILNQDDLRQLKQRIAVRLALTPLASAEITEYIRHRWLRAGGAAHPFSPEAVEDIGSISHGIPRVINLVCHTALIGAFAERSSRVEYRHVRDAAKNLDLGELPEREAIVEPADAPAGATPYRAAISRLSTWWKSSRWVRWARNRRLAAGHEGM
jgi:general secretion pathway protein A